MAVVHGEGKARRRVRKAREEREAEILDAATRVFAGTGYRAADVQQVADLAGVGKGTVYRYFPTKEALFRATLRRSLDRLRACSEAARAGVEDPLTQLGSVMRAYFGFFDDNPEAVELFIHERAEFPGNGTSLYFAYFEAHYREWEGMIVRLQRAGVLRDLPARTILELLNDMAYGAVVSSRLSSNRAALRARADLIIDVFLNGLAARPQAGA